MSTANYAENLIAERLGDFRFQPRAGSGSLLNMKAISRADVSQIIRRGDHEALQLLLNDTNIIKADVSGEDFDFHSSDLLLKLFQICQLSLELSHTKTEMLATELIEVYRNFQRKAAEAKSLTKNLIRQDEEVAMLRDELYHRKEASKKAEADEQPRLLDHSMFPSQERRVVNSSEFSGDGDDVSTQSISDDATEIKLHVVSPSHGFYIQLIVDETCTIRNLQNKIMVRCFLGEEGEMYNIDFEQSSLYYKDQELHSTGTLKEYRIMSDSALVILSTSPANKDRATEGIVPISPNTIESKLDEIKTSTELLAKGMSSFNEMLQEVLRTEASEVRFGNAPKLNGIDSKRPSLEANDDEQNVSQLEMKQTKGGNAVNHPLTLKDVEQGVIRHETVELKVDTTENDAWPFGLNFNAESRPPSEINVTKNTVDGTTKTSDDVKSPPKADCCDCSAEEVCDECVNAYSPRSLQAVVTSNQVDGRQFTFSAFENSESGNDTADYDYSCDKSDSPLQIGAKESNVVTDSDLQSIEMSLEEYALGLEAHEGKKKSRFLKKLTFKPKWKHLKSKRKVNF
jgi:hypothetical protein